jgi:hypothetical protein
MQIGTVDSLDQGVCHCAKFLDQHSNQCGAFCLDFANDLTLRSPLG